MGGLWLVNELGNKVASSDLSLAATVAHSCMENGYGRVASCVDVLMVFSSVYLNKDKIVVRRYITGGGGSKNMSIVNAKKRGIKSPKSET